MGYLAEEYKNDNNGKELYSGSKVANNKLKAKFKRESEFAKI